MLRTAVRDPELCVLVGGHLVHPASIDRLLARFILPADCGDVVLRSRAARPTELRPWLTDRRRLGVSVARIRLHGNSGTHEIPVDHPTLKTGWWDVERSDGAMWRWTDGAAHLTLPRQREAAIVEIYFATVPSYPAARSQAALGAGALAA